MRIAHLSDFHYTKLTLNPFRLFPKRIFCHFNSLILRRKAFSFAQIERLPKLFCDLKIDLVLFGGDFTSSALPQEFSLVKLFLKNISQPWIAVPGNHDNYTSRSLLKNFPICTQKLLENSVEIHKIASGWWVISLNTSLPNSPISSRGLFSKELEAKLEEIACKIPDGEKAILLNHYPFFQQEDPKRSLERGDALEALLKRHPKIALYLHGHTHRHSIADLRPNQLPIVLDSGSCSLTRGGTWNLIDLEENKCSVSTYQWESQWNQKKILEFAWT